MTAPSETFLAEQMERVARTLKVGHVVCLLHFGDMPNELCRYSTELFATRVMPKIKNIWNEYEDHWSPKPMPAATVRPLDHGVAFGGDDHPHGVAKFVAGLEDFGGFAVVRRRDRNIDILGMAYAEAAIGERRDGVAQFGRGWQVRIGLLSFPGEHRERTHAFLRAHEEGKQQEGAKFSDYFEHDEKLAKVPSHRALAMFRGRNEGILGLAIRLPGEEDAPVHPAQVAIARQVGIRDEGRPADKWLVETARWAWRTTTPRRTRWSAPRARVPAS